MMADRRFQINSPPFAHQTIQGEVVIVNVETGNYYSLTGTGAEVWALLEGGGGIPEIVTGLERRYRTPRQQIEGGVIRLIAELQQEGIVGPGSPGASASPRPADDVPSGTAEALEPDFAPPVLEKFTDMKDLLLLDPIHELGTAEWPIVKYPEP